MKRRTAPLHCWSLYLAWPILHSAYKQGCLKWTLGREETKKKLWGRKSNGREGEAKGEGKGQGRGRRRNRNGGRGRRFSIIYSQIKEYGGVEISYYLVF